MQQRPFDTVLVNREGSVGMAWEHLSIEDYPIHECFNRDTRKTSLLMINGVQQYENLVYLSLRTTSRIIAVDKNTNKVWN